MDLPTGLVTFLFTDIEGSTRLWEDEPEAMGRALARHNQILRESIESQGGHVFNLAGDSFCAAFQAAPEALCAAVTGQHLLTSESWPQTARILVRMAIHSRGWGAARE